MGWKVLAFSKTAFPPKNCHITSGAGGDTFYDPAFSSCKCLFLRPHTVLYFSSQVWVKPCFGNVTISKEVATRFFSWHAITIHIHCVIFLEPLFPIADFFSLLAPLLFLNDDKWMILWEWALSLTLPPSYSLYPTHCLAVNLRVRGHNCFWSPTSSFLRNVRLHAIFLLQYSLWCYF